MAKPQYTYKAKIEKVIDADTIDLVLDVGFYIKLNIRTRLLGVNAPETSTQAGRDARDYVKRLLPAGTDVVVETAKDPTDKYGRWLARVHHGSTCLNDHLVEQKLAVPYMT